MFCTPNVITHWKRTVRSKIIGNLLQTTVLERYFHFVIIVFPGEYLPELYAKVDHTSTALSLQLLHQGQKNPSLYSILSKEEGPLLIIRYKLAVSNCTGIRTSRSIATQPPHILDTPDREPALQPNILQVATIFSPACT